MEDTYLIELAQGLKAAICPWPLDAAGRVIVTCPDPRIKSGARVGSLVFSRNPEKLLEYGALSLVQHPGECKAAKVHFCGRLDCSHANHQEVSKKRLATVAENLGTHFGGDLPSEYWDERAPIRGLTYLWNGPAGHTIDVGMLALFSVEGFILEACAGYEELVRVLILLATATQMANRPMTLVVAQSHQPVFSSVEIEALAEIAKCVEVLYVETHNK